MNKNVIFFVISDNYSFAAANMIMGLKRHSGELLRTCDVLIYHDGIPEQNMRLLRQLHPDTYFEEMIFPDIWKPILEHEKTKKWGHYVVAKLFGFRLIEKYDYALLLDVDMLVLGDLSELFTIEEEIAWRKIMAWDPKVAFGPVLKNKDDDIRAGSAGMLMYTKKLRKYAIDDDKIRAAFDVIKILKRGGMDEWILGYLVYDNHMVLKELDVKLYNTPAMDWHEEKGAGSHLLHFIDWKDLVTKPWKNYAAYLYFPEWSENDAKWREMGGQSLASFTDANRFDLLATGAYRDKDDLKKKAASLTEENKKLKASLTKAQNELNRIHSTRIYRIYDWLRKKKRKWIGAKKDKKR